MTTESLLGELGGSSTTNDARRSALSKLLASKAFQKNAGAPEVQQALCIWRDLAANDGATDGVRLVALSELVRMGVSAQTLSSQVDRLIQEVLASGLPPIDAATEADVRLNVARALRKVMPSWSSAYAAHAIASEEKGDKARAEFTSALVASNPTIADALSALRLAFAAATFPTEDPTRVALRRAAKALEEVRRESAIAGLTPGAEFGTSLDSLARAVLAKDVRDEASKIELATQVIALVQSVVRSKFSAAIEPETFNAIRRMRGLFLGERWPTILGPALNPLASDIKEAIVILAKQGVVSQPLLQQLEVVVGSRDAAKEATAQLASEVPEIPEDAKHFLVQWRPKMSLTPSSASIEETALQQVDAFLGESLRDEASSRLGAAELRYAQESVSSFDPEASLTFDALLSRDERFQKTLAELARRRRVGLLGIPGEEMAASAKYFSSLSGKLVSTVLVPAIVRFRPDGTPGACLLKGQLQ